jgi:fumarylacetoacetase
MASTQTSVARSWVSVSPDSDFPIQNLPFGVARLADGAVHAVSAIGDYVVDLHVLRQSGFFHALGLPNDVFDQPALNAFLRLGKPVCRQVRLRLAELLDEGNTELKNSPASQQALIAHQQVQLLLPVQPGNYTDFYSSEEHATNVGSMFRDPKNALLPNWKHLPVGYHGRASSIVVSGTPIRRPKGQIKSSDAEQPVFCPSQKLDFELEMAFVTCRDTALGTSVSTREATDHIFGFVLFNDWSARDIQQWEYVPLGPFLGKNFGSTMSPWIVTLDALEPCRVPGPEQFPHVLPYLAFEGNQNFDIAMEVLLQPQAGEAVTVCRSNHKYLYWNVCQQLAHHTVNGCNICVGDIFASGTISGPSPGSYGSLLELTWNGQRPLHLYNGTTRTFIEDGDTITMKAHAMAEGVRIGFGECTGEILPAN